MFNGIEINQYLLNSSHVLHYFHLLLFKSNIALMNGFQGCHFILSKMYLLHFLPLQKSSSRNYQNKSPHPQGKPPIQICIYPPINRSLAPIHHHFQNSHKKLRQHQFLL